MGLLQQLYHDAELGFDLPCQCHTSVCSSRASGVFTPDLKRVGCLLRHADSMLRTLWQGGMPKKHQDALRKELLHTYGHEYLITLSLLQSAGASLPPGADHHAGRSRAQKPTDTEVLRY